MICGYLLYSSRHFQGRRRWGSCFALASMFSSYYSASPKNLGMSMASPSLEIVLRSLQRIPKLIDTTCPLRARFLPFCCHARYVPSSFIDHNLTRILQGSFASLYKLILNALPIISPPSVDYRPAFSRSPSPTTPSSQVTMGPTPADKRRGRLSFRAQAHETWARKKARRWHAVVAGAVAGGLGIMFEKRSRRVAISQQLFVRYAIVPHY